MDELYGAEGNSCKSVVRRQILLRCRVARNQADTFDLVTVEALDCAAKADENFGGGDGFDVAADYGAITEFHGVVSGDP